MARISRTVKRARDTAIREARRFGLQLSASFDGWNLPASRSYSGTAGPADPDGFARDCRRELQRILSITLGRRFIRVVTASDPVDVVVGVKLRGTGLTGGPYVGPRGRTGMAVSGAIVRGVISLQPRSAGDEPLPPISRSFRGRVSPPNAMADHRAWGSPPFVRALQDADPRAELIKLLRSCRADPGA